MLKQNPSNALDFHTQIAEQFDSTYAYDPNRLERLRVWDAYLAKYAAGVGLAYDLGCGTGAITAVLAAYAKRIIAIDGAEGMLKVARANAKARGFADRVDFQQNRLPMPISTDLPHADLVISSSAIEYMDSISETLAFTRSLLVEGGTLVFSMSNRDSISRQFVRAVHRVTGRPKYIRHLRHFVTIEDLESSLRDAGFTPLKHAYFGGADRLNRALGLLVAPQRACNMIIIAARRNS